jgi:fused signal recognition particle receptor
LDGSEKDNKNIYKSPNIYEFMFSKLKEKLKNWAQKLSKGAGKEEELDESKEKPKKKKTERKREKIKEEREVSERIIEDIKKEQEKKKIEEKPGFFSRLKSKVTKIKITEKEFGVYAEELEMLLLENNVALEVSERIIKELKEKIIGKELLKKEIEYEIYDFFKEIINEILIAPFDIVEKIRNREDKTKPFVILFCGVNGGGKTTTIAKIAEYLRKNKLTSVLAASDTFRAASIEQIKKHGEKLNIPVIAHEYGSDPASVGFDAIKYASKKRIDVVLIDTAGRMHTSKNLMNEIEKISKVNRPDLKIFVGESITGNDAVEQAKAFNWAVGIDGIILTKADIDEKGGTALSVGYITKKPILFLGTGQEYDEIEPFDKKKFIEKLGLGKKDE